MNPNQVFLAHNTATSEFTKAMLKLEESGQCRELLPELLRLRADVAALDPAPKGRSSVVAFVGAAGRCREPIEDMADQISRLVMVPFVRGEWELAEAVYHLRRAQGALILAAHAVHRSGNTTRESRSEGTISTQTEGGE